MKIGIDASRSRDTIKKTGVEMVSDGLIKAFLSLEANNEFVFYTPEIISWIPKEKQILIKRKRLWTLFGLSKELKKNKPDVFFSPVHELPFYLPKKTYRIVHDIAFKKNPKLYNIKQKLYMCWGLKRSIKKCKKIFVSTEQVKKDLLKFTEAKNGQVVVVGLGYEKFKSKPEKTRKKQLLYIGRIEEKKNIINLVKAFNIFNKDNEYKLILAGKEGRGFDKIKKGINESEGIKLLGYISDEKKLELLRESSLLVHVPNEEGFSYPLLEAFDCGLPVVAADISALREVGGAACIYVDQQDPEKIAVGINKVIENPNIQKDLINKGKQRLGDFFWGKVAQQILAILKS